MGCKLYINFTKHIQGRGGGYSGFQVTGMIKWSQKSILKKFQQNPKKSLDQKLTPKKPHANFNLWPSKVPERGNAITQRKTWETEHLCFFSSYHLNISFPSSGSHFKKVERVQETPKNGFVSTATL